MVVWKEAEVSRCLWWRFVKVVLKMQFCYRLKKANNEREKRVGLFEKWKEMCELK